MQKLVRFRTLGCYPLTGAVESSAVTLPEIIEEMLLAKQSERQGRVIDYDEAGSMDCCPRLSVDYRGHSAKCSALDQIDHNATPYTTYPPHLFCSPLLPLLSVRPQKAL